MQRWPRSLVPLVLLAGCSLVIGDIDLPPSPSDDAAPRNDARPRRRDAAPDSAPPADAASSSEGGLDAADDGVADDGGDDGGASDGVAGGDATPRDGPTEPDAAPPPVDVAALAGTWHVYGVTLRGGRARILAGRLDITEHGNQLLDAGGTLLADDVPVQPDPTDPGRLQVELSPLTFGPLVGAIGVEAGVGFVVAATERGVRPTFVVLVRLDGQQALPAETTYVRADLSWAGELGVLAAEPPVFLERQRSAVGGGLLPEQALIQIEGQQGRRVLLADNREARVLTAAPAGRGAAGYLERGEQKSGLWMGWSVPQPGQLTDGTLRCGAFFERDGALAVRSAQATIEGGSEGGSEGGFTWRGSPTQHPPVIDRFHQLADAGPLFPERGALISADDAGLILLLLPLLPDDSLGWGFGLCVLD